MADSDIIGPETGPAGVLNDTCVMEAFSISVNDGILKHLQNLTPGKAAGPDRNKPLLLKELREEIAPIIQVIFKRSIKTGKLPADWCRAQVTPVFQKGDPPPNTGLFPTCILCKALSIHFSMHSMASHLSMHLDT